MRTFPEDPRLGVIRENWYELLEDYRYRWEKDGRKYQLIVKTGFQTDLSSVPKAIWWLISPQDLGLGPPIFHDALYRVGGITFESKWIRHLILQLGTLDKWAQISEAWTRKQTDRLFGRMMREKGIEIWRRRMAYRGVRVGGFWSWS